MLSSGEDICHKIDAILKPADLDARLPEEIDMQLAVSTKIRTLPLMRYQVGEISINGILDHLWNASLASCGVSRVIDT